MLTFFSFFFFQTDKELSESSKDGMTLTGPSSSLIRQAEGPSPLVFLGPVQRGRLGKEPGGMLGEALLFCV